MVRDGRRLLILYRALLLVVVVEVDVVVRVYERLIHLVN